ncbi:MAG TPA: LuxR C-terminal-related transcriptional regulator, partial [Candidatus Kapabacteria bacterium]|nr:LuxR C-terminal-related transcriptional regulator [Candidatus Kapabacteria bacterium]
QLESALTLARQINHPETLADVLIRLSRIYQEENKIAKDLLREALEITRTIGDLRAETDALELISNCFAKDGNFKQAFETLQLHTQKRMQLLKHESNLEIKAIETRRELEAIRSEVELHRLRADDLAKRVNEKEKDLSMLALHLVEKQAFIGHLKRHLQKPHDVRQSLSQLVNRLEKEVQDESGWHAFEQEFEQLSGGFFKLLSAKHPNLTTAELKVCGLLRIGLSSKRIGGMLHISPSTVDTHRKHIRTKLALGDRKSLMGYLAGL